MRLPGTVVVLAQAVVSALWLLAVVTGSVLPTGATLGAFGDAFSAGLESAQLYEAPVPPNVPSVHALLLVGGALTLLATRPPRLHPPTGAAGRARPPDGILPPGRGHRRGHLVVDLRVRRRGLHRHDVHRPRRAGDPLGSRGRRRGRRPDGLRRAHRRRARLRGRDRRHGDRDGHRAARAHPDARRLAVRGPADPASARSRSRTRWSTCAATWPAARTSRWST